MFDIFMMDYLACPRDGDFPLRLKNVQQTREDGIYSAEIVCDKCNSVYPVINAVPIMLTEGLKNPSGSRNVSVDLNSNEPNKDLWMHWKEKHDNSVASYISEGLSHETWIAPFVSFADIRGDILDIGCGDIQNVIKYFNTKKILHYFGIDPFVFSTNTPYRFVQGVGERLPFRPNKFDSILILTSLDHVAQPKKVFQEAARVVKPDGKVYVVSLVWNSHFELDHDPYHLRHFSNEDMNNYFNAADLNITKVDSIAWKQPWRRVYFYELQSKSL